MSQASNYTEANVMNAIFKGVAFPLPAGLYLSLHTANPTDAGGNEVSTSAWPSYVRRDAAVGGAIGTGWNGPTDGVVTNALQILWPSNNGAGAVNVTHWALYDAASNGNMITYGPLTTSRSVGVGDVFVFDVGQVTVTMA